MAIELHRVRPLCDVVKYKKMNSSTSQDGRTRYTNKLSIFSTRLVRSKLKKDVNRSTYFNF